MKATLIQLLLFILKYLSEKSAAFLNEEEESITKGLMKELEIRHWILVLNENSNLSDFTKLKNYAKRNIPFMILSISLLSKYFSKESVADVNALIVLKVSDISIVSNLLWSLTFVSIIKVFYENLKKSCFSLIN